MNKWNNRHEKTRRHDKDRVCKKGDNDDVKGEIGKDAEMLMRLKLMSFLQAHATIMRAEIMRGY